MLSGGCFISRGRDFEIPGRLLEARFILTNNQQPFRFCLVTVLGLVFCLANSATAQLSSLAQPATMQESRSRSTNAYLDDSGAVVIPSALVKIAHICEVPVEQAGVLAEVLVREGRSVKRGELIARLADTDYQLELERAKLELQISKAAAVSDVDVEYARKSLEVATADLNRSEQANARVENSIPQSRIEKQRLERERTRLQLKKAIQDLEAANWNAELAENKVRQVEWQLAKTQIQSPVEGMISAVEKRAGEWVEPSQTVVRIVQVDRLQVEGFVPVSLARKIKPDMPVKVQFDYDWFEQPVDGKILFINPEANPMNLNLQVWVEVENSDRRLVPGMRGTILIAREQISGTK